MQGKHKKAIEGQCSWIAGSSWGNYVQVFLHGCRHEFAFHVLQIAVAAIFCSPGLPWMWHSMNNSHRHLPTLRPEMWCSSASRTRASLSRTKTAEFRRFEKSKFLTCGLGVENGASQVRKLDIQVISSRRYSPNCSERAKSTCWILDA